MAHFPLPLATGSDFCNRKDELARLQHNFKNAHPTSIIAPRRYGKTSLAMNAIQQFKQHYAVCDFLAAVDETDVERIINCIGQLLAGLSSGPKNLCR